MSVIKPDDMDKGPLVDVGDRMPVLQNYLIKNSIPHTEEELNRLDKMLSEIGKEYR